jgi:hypothetical protein
LFVATCDGFCHVFKGICDDRPLQECLLFSSTIGSSIVTLKVEDVNDDGVKEVIVATSDRRLCIYVYDPVKVTLFEFGQIRTDAQISSMAPIPDKGIELPILVGYERGGFGLFESLKIQSLSFAEELDTITPTSSAAYIRRWSHGKEDLKAALVFQNGVDRRRSSLFIHLYHTLGVL